MQQDVLEFIYNESEKIPKYIPVEDFAQEKATDTWADTAFYAYKEYKDKAFTINAAEVMTSTPKAIHQNLLAKEVQGPIRL